MHESILYKIAKSTLKLTGTIFLTQFQWIGYITTLTYGEKSGKLVGKVDSKFDIK